MKTKDLIYIGVILLLLLYIFFSFRNQKGQMASLQQAQEEYLEQERKTWRDKEGSMNEMIHSLVLDKESLLNSLDGKRAELRKLKEAYGRALEKLERFQQVQAITVIELRDSISFISGDVEPEFDEEERITQINFKQGDVWHVLSGYITPDTMKYELMVNNQLEVTHFKERTGFLGLGGYEYNVLVTSLSPYSIIKTQSAVIREKPKRFVVGPSIGLGWTGGGIEPTLGVGVVYRMFSF